MIMSPQQRLQKQLQQHHNTLKQQLELYHQTMYKYTHPFHHCLVNADTPIKSVSIKKCTSAATFEVLLPKGRLINDVIAIDDVMLTADARMLLQRTQNGTNDHPHPANIRDSSRGSDSNTHHRNHHHHRRSSSATKHAHVKCYEMVHDVTGWSLYFRERTVNNGAGIPPTPLYNGTACVRCDATSATTLLVPRTQLAVLHLDLVKTSTVDVGNLMQVYMSAQREEIAVTLCPARVIAATAEAAKSALASLSTLSTLTESSSSQTPLLLGFDSRLRSVFDSHSIKRIVHYHGRSQQVPSSSSSSSS
jgi:hypothetical protein